MWEVREIISSLPICSSARAQAYSFVTLQACSVGIHKAFAEKATENVDEEKLILRINLKQYGSSEEWWNITEEISAEKKKIMSALIILTKDF